MNLTQDTAYWNFETDTFDTFQNSLGILNNLPQEAVHTCDDQGFRQVQKGFQSWVFFLMSFLFISDTNDDFYFHRKSITANTTAVHAIVSFLHDATLFCRLSLYVITSFGVPTVGCVVEEIWLLNHVLVWLSSECNLAWKGRPIQQTTAGRPLWHTSVRFSLSVRTRLYEQVVASIIAANSCRSLLACLWSCG